MGMIRRYSLREFFNRCTTDTTAESNRPPLDKGGLQGGGVIAASA